MTNDTQKDWDASAPFHRINSVPSKSYYDTSMTNQPDGQGYYAGGCRNPNDFTWTLAFGLARRDLVRMLPNWTTVPKPNPYLQEVEGKLVRSFQTWTDTPMRQWHKWYDWNFHVQPMDGYKYVRGKGNDAPASARTPIVPAGAMELEWDTGAFGLGVGGHRPGALWGSMFAADWAWPMTEQHIWAAGEWIYDCGHANSAGLMRTELHPVRAVATARWEAAKFDSSTTKVLWPRPGTSGAVSSTDAPRNLPLPSNTLYQPAIQFMFFASRFGGYVDSAALPDLNRDYEFIVDLPPVKSTSNPAPIGPQHTFPLNTIVVKSPKLLCSFDFRPFTNMQRTLAGTFSMMEPEVTYDPTQWDQVKVKIPLSKLPAGTDAYGVIISLGWLDDDNTLARSILHCTVTMGDITVNDAKTGSLTFKWGANGRWKSQDCDNVKTGDVIRLNTSNKSVDFWLMKDLPTAAGADIFINTHGVAIDRVGTFMEKSESDRTLHMSMFDQGAVVTWYDVVHGSDSVIGGIGDSITTKLAETVRMENKPLAIFDWHYHAGTVPSGATGKNLTIIPPSMVEDPQLAELFEGSGSDYSTIANIKVEPQRVP
jgi:hypothetical protein